MDAIKRDMNLMRRLQKPTGCVDVVLDTDAYNEIDDQFAIAYLCKAKDRCRLLALYAAPFHNQHSTGPKDGMERSYLEIKKVLKLADEEALVDSVFEGSPCYLTDEKTPVASPAALDLVERSKAYNEDKPLYVVAIGAITNVASALLLDPTLKDRVVIVWLGGTSPNWDHSHEFNMFQDVAAARVVFGSEAPVVQIPCAGVAEMNRTTKPELLYWLGGKSELSDYLAKNTIAEAEAYALGKPWSRVIWDVVAAAWVLDREDKFTKDHLIPAPIPEYDDHYAFDKTRHILRSVYSINRDAIFEDLFPLMTGEKKV